MGQAPFLASHTPYLKTQPQPIPFIFFTEKWCNSIIKPFFFKKKKLATNLFLAYWFLLGNFEVFYQLGWVASSFWLKAQKSLANTLWLINYQLYNVSLSNCQVTQIVLNLHILNCLAANSWTELRNFKVVSVHYDHRQSEVKVLRRSPSTKLSEHEQNERNSASTNHISLNSYTLNIRLPSIDIITIKIQPQWYKFLYFYSPLCCNIQLEVIRFMTAWGRLDVDENLGTLIKEKPYWW